MCLKHSTVSIFEHLSGPFPIQKGLKQEDALLPLI